MKLREVFVYEVAHRLRSASTWVYAAILFLFAFWLMPGFADVGPVYANAPEELARLSLVIGLLGLLVSAALFGDAAVRDIQVGMDPLLFTSSLRKAEYLGGRFLAALATNAVVAIAIPAGLVTTALLGVPDTAAFGPVRPSAYLQPYLLFVLPNVLFAGTILFTTGVLARQMIPVYLVGIGLFASYLLTVNGVGQTDNPILSVLSDPVGIRTFSEMTEYWTAADRNAQLIGFPVELGVE